MKNMRSASNGPTSGQRVDSWILAQMRSNYRPGVAFSALPVALAGVDQLRRDMLLDRHTGTGFGWWRGELAQDASEQLADYSVQCIDATSKNALEAWLSLIDYCKATHADTGFDEQWVQSGVDGVPLRPILTRNREKFDDIKVQWDLERHLKDLFQSAFSMMDCTAAAAVVACGFDFRDVRKRASLGALRAHLKDSKPDRAKEFLPLATFDSFVRQSGPTGWQAWLNEMRNMLSHRGRVLWMATWEGGPFRRTRGRLERHARPVYRLPAGPADADVSASLRVLNEQSDQSAFEMLFSTCRFCDALLCAAANIWIKRRDNPAGWPQPATQWQHTAGATNFLGFTGNGLYPDSGDRIITAHPDTNERFASRHAASGKGKMK